MSGIRTLQQQINALHQFDGTAPTGAMSISHGIEQWAAQNAGGLFDFTQTRPIPLRGIFVKFGGQASWSLSLKDALGNLYTILTGTNEVSYYKDLSGLWLMEGDQLALVTAGATTAMLARITAALH